MIAAGSVVCRLIWAATTGTATNFSGPSEFGCRFDDVIRRRDDHDRVRFAAGDQSGAQSDARGRVAPARFADDVGRRQSRQLAARFFSMSFGSDDPCIRGRHLRFDRQDQREDRGGDADEQRRRYPIVLRHAGLRHGS